MGETAELRNQQAGTFGFNNFIAQGDNDATIGRMLRTMVPTVDMRDFQRSWRFSSGRQAVGIGQTIAVRWVVPIGEAWKIQGLFWENADSATHNINVFFTVNRSLLGDAGAAVSAYRAALMQVNANGSKAIYGVNIQLNTSSAQYHQFLDLTLEPGDAFSVQAATASTLAVSPGWTMLYEIVPAPSIARTRGVAGLRVVT